MTSAYPTPVDDLVPAARELMAQTGSLPSRNRLMSTLRIGAPKAERLLSILAAETNEERPLHLVPDAVSDPGSDPDPAPSEPTTPPEPSPLVTTDGNPDPNPGSTRLLAGKPWPLILLALPAFVAIWSGWVGLGELTGFGVVHPLPGIADDFTINSAITLPIGVEAYAAYALRAWLGGGAPPRARRFAMVSAIGALALGAAGQVAYHLMSAAGMTTAPWQITTFVACLPVVVLGCGAALAHLLHSDQPATP